MSSLLHTNFIKSTVSIKNGLNPHGTGFIIGIKSYKDDGYHLYLITNLHVINGLSEITVCINKKEGGIGEEKIQVNDQRIKFCGIEGINGCIDVVATKIDHNYLINNNYECFFIPEEWIIKSKEEYIHNIETGDDVFLLGFPLGMNGIQQNSPIARGGIVARVDDELLNNYNIYLDINNFPGNSGGPIITKPTNISLVDKTPSNKSYLIGIINSYIPYRKNYFVNDNGNFTPSMFIDENSGIAIGIPIYIVYEIIKNKLDEIIRSKNPDSI